MLASLKWLRDYVDITISPEELSECLTMAGLEVDAIREFTPEFSGVIVAKILSIKPHPNADKLSVCEVTDGKKMIPIVCGAPNVATGRKVALAKVGANLPGGFKIKSSKIRGVESEGMLCSEEELGIGPDASGIMVLPEQATLGDDLKDALNLKDTVLDIGVTPNRGDCLSIIGIAREISALTGEPLRYPEIAFGESAEKTSDITSVEIISPELCPRYTARIIKGVKIGPSPSWMRERLEAVGLRSISNVVDVTNFVMMEFGQPLHAFDFNFLEEGRIVVRRAGEGEEFVSLDGKTRLLSGDTLMICDGKKTVAVGGVMGGLDSEVKPETNTILLESAYFNPTSIRRSSRYLGMPTDAAFRFERGIDPEGVIRALNRAAQLIKQTAGGEITKGCIDMYPNKIEAPRGIPLRMKRIREILGVSVPEKTVRKILANLEMTVGPDRDGGFVVIPPTFRGDVAREIDLIEEVARIHGFEHIAETMPAPAVGSEARDVKRRVHAETRAVFVGHGYSEVINYSFTAPDSAGSLGIPPNDPGRRFISISNPLSENQSVMRTNLLYGLLENMRKNINAGNPGLKLFEIGKVFFARGAGELPREVEKLGGIICGRRYEDFWHLGTSADFYDVKGVLESLFNKLKIEGATFSAAADIPYLHPGRAASISVAGKKAGYIGEIHPEIIERMDLRKRAVVFELEMEFLTTAFRKSVSFRGVPKFPAVTRDVALLLDEQIEAQKVLDLVNSESEEMLENVIIFDIYKGQNIPRHMKSLALRFTYRHPERTLTDEDVAGVHDRIVKKIIESTKARIRGE